MHSSRMSGTDHIKERGLNLLNLQRKLDNGKVLDHFSAMYPSSSFFFSPRDLRSVRGEDRTFPSTVE